MREKLIVGNWKMNGSLVTNSQLIQQLKQHLEQIKLSSAVAVCVPTVYLTQVGELIADTNIALGAQDISVHDNGAYTGEVSAAMLKDVATQYVIVGHSERRSYHGETDKLVAQKTVAALKAGLKPIICIGETLEQRQAQQTKDVVLQQLNSVLQEVVAYNADLLLQCTLAYEPVWAIGTGQTATPEQAQQVHHWLRQEVAKYDVQVANSLQILYGGSMNATNAEQLLSQVDIDGGLIGGASLKAKDFAAIISAASK